MKDCQFLITKKFRWSKSRVKAILLTFLTLEGLFIKNLHKVDKQPTKLTIWKYCKVRRKQTKLFANNSWILHHKNAPAHTALSLKEFFAIKQKTMLEHPAYSSNLASKDFFLLSKIKEILKGRHFDDIGDIRSNTTAPLKAIPQNQFQNCFEGWTRHWHRYLDSLGEYFQGDHGGIHRGM